MPGYAIEMQSVSDVNWMENGRDGVLCIVGLYRAAAATLALRAGRAALESIMELMEVRWSGEKYRTAGSGCVDYFCFCFCCRPDGSMMGSFGVKVAQGASTEAGYFA